MSVTVKVRNKDKLARKLKQLAPAVQAAITDANAATAQEMAANARRLAPVGDTGNLQASIRAEPAGTVTGAWRMSAGGPTTTKPSRGGSYDYALGVEFGHGEKKKGKVPFFFTGYRIGAKRHRSRVTRAANKAHKQVASR